MALEFGHNCPYCGTRGIGYTGRFNWKTPATDHQKFVLATCNGCQGGVIFLLHLRKHSADYDFNAASGNLQTNDLTISRSWPDKVDNHVPDDLPPPIESLFVQALNCVRQGAWDAAGMTFRKVIDVSTKLLDKTSANKKLANRIDDLAEKGKITLDLKDWAHEVRLDGNEAAHEDEPFSKDQAESLSTFVEAYLKYIYTFPALVQKNRTARSQRDNSPVATVA
jgi:Domain of unknown function (DUF4145)